MGTCKKPIRTHLPVSCQLRHMKFVQVQVALLGQAFLDVALREVATTRIQSNQVLEQWL
jgi:hypothetical protein